MTSQENLKDRDDVTLQYADTTRRRGHSVQQHLTSLHTASALISSAPRSWYILGRVRTSSFSRVIVPHARLPLILTLPQITTPPATHAYSQVPLRTSLALLGRSPPREPFGVLPHNSCTHPNTQTPQTHKLKHKHCQVSIQI